MIGKLKSVQKKTLVMCLGQPITASKDALEIAAGIQPLDLRFAEVAMRDIAKIVAKSPNNPK